MTEQQMREQAVYLATMKIARSYLERGIITEEQYRQYDTVMKQKYVPFFGDLFPRNILT